MPLGRIERDALWTDLRRKSVKFVSPLPAKIFYVETNPHSCREIMQWSIGHATYCHGQLLFDHTKGHIACFFLLGYVYDKTIAQTEHGGEIIEGNEEIPLKRSCQTSE
jgi:hypothetical protein